MIINKHGKYKIFDETIRKLRVLTRRFTLPGFNGVPIYHAVKFFITGIKKGSITTRASSIAFQTFLASLPAIILLFSIIPHIPVDNFKEGVLTLLESILPNSAFLALRETLEYEPVQKAGFEYFGLLVTLVFSTNAIKSIIAVFNETYHLEENRNWFQKMLTSLFLVVIIATLLIISIGLIIAGRYILAYFVDIGFLKMNIVFYLLWMGKWIVFFALIYFAIDFLYFFAPLKSARLKLFSAGSTFAAILTVLSTMIFDYFIDNFGQFNRLFGSVGTIIIIMMWIYFNALSLLIGFELNASIRNAHLKGWELPKKKKNQLSEPIPSIP